MTRRKPHAANTKAAPVSKTRRPPRAAPLRRTYDDDDDSLEIPDTALGGGKE